jgi:hypothetical protein
MLDKALRERGETWADVESSTLTDAELGTPFDSGHGVNEGRPFTVWTRHSVYFPLTYDGLEWVGSVARHPDGKPTPHQGGY